MQKSISTKDKAADQKSIAKLEKSLALLQQAYRENARFREYIDGHLSELK